jgi:hypothetical protein
LTDISPCCFWHKRIHFSNLLLFRIRFSDYGKELRLVYLVEGSTVKLLFILDRDKGYASLDKYLSRVDLIWFLLILPS